MSESTQPLNSRMIVYLAGPRGFFKDSNRFADVICFGILSLFAFTVLGGQRIRSMG